MQQGYFNYNSIVTEAGKQNVGGFQQFNTGMAVLYVFTPKVLPTQVLRPFQFNFGTALVNELSHYRSIQEAISPMGAGNKEAINKAVLPDASGIISNCNDISTKWTFMLILDVNQYQYQGLRNCAPCPDMRQIGIGYFTDEPLAFGNALNPNAIMVFTHTTNTIVTDSFGSLGPQKITSINGDVDVIAGSTANMYATPMFIGTPGDIMKTVDMTSTGECIGNIGDIMVQNVSGDTPSPMVDNILKSPRHFLNDIGESLDLAVDTAISERENTLRSKIMPSVFNDELQDSRSRFAGHAQNSSHVRPSNGFCMNRPCTINELEMRYPNLVVKPLQIPQFSTWSVSPQDSMSLRNTASSLIASSLSSLVQACGLTNISFYYESYRKESPFSTKRTGLWHIMDAGTLYPCDEEAKKRYIKTFQEQMEMSVYPILLTLNGDFSLGVVYNSGGEILIDLLFLDQTQGFTQGEGYYETNSRLGGMLNPVMTDQNGLMHNSTELRNLVDTMLGKKLGPDIFHQGSDQYVTEALNNGQAMDIGNFPMPQLNNGMEEYVPVVPPQQTAPTQQAAPVRTFEYNI